MSIFAEKPHGTYDIYKPKAWYENMARIRENRHRRVARGGYWRAYNQVFKFGALKGLFRTLKR